MKRPDDEAWVAAKWGEKFGIKVSHRESSNRGSHPLSSYGRSAH
jgi:hypothetical protein